MKVENKTVTEKIEDYFINEFGYLLQNAGAKLLLGRIYGYLLSKTEPVSLKAISEKLKVTKSAISATIKPLVQMDFIRKAYNPDFPREDFYYVEFQSAETLIKPSIVKLGNFQEKFSVALDMINREGYVGGNNEKIEDLQKKIEYMRNVYEITIEEFSKVMAVIHERITKLEK